MAVLGLMTRSNLVGACTGRSPGLGALEDAVDVGRRTAKQVDWIDAVVHAASEDDVSGVILSSAWSSEWVHLMVPAEYEWRRHCVMGIGWQDPRGLDDKSEPLVVVEPSGERHQLERCSPACLRPRAALAGRKLS